MTNRNAAWFKISGTCGILTPVFAFTCILLAVFLYPQFSWSDMALSDLGVVAGATSMLFNAGLIISGLLTLAFGSGLLKFLQEKALGQIGGFVFLLDALALISIGVFPENAKPMHYYASVAFFALFPTSMVLITGAFLLMAKVKVGLFTLLAAIFTMAVWVVQFSIRPFHGVAIPETLSALAASTWSMILGLKMLKVASGSTSRQQDGSICEMAKS